MFFEISESLIIPEFSNIVSGKHDRKNGENRNSVDIVMKSFVV